MKKVFQKAFLFVATMTLSLGFASCSDDDDPVTEGNVVPATELSAVANTYVNDIKSYLQGFERQCQGFEGCMRQGLRQRQGWQLERC